MNILLGLIFVIYIVFKISITYNKRISNNDKVINILSLFIFANFFYFSQQIDNTIYFILLGALLIFQIKSLGFNNYLRIYLIFLLYSTLTLSYSQSIVEGLKMILKFILPILFLIIGYSTIINKDTFIKFLYKSKKYFIPLSIISCLPALLADFTKEYQIFRSWVAGNAYSCTLLACIPLSLYCLTKNKKYLINSIIMGTPAFALIRRAAIGGYFIIISTYLYMRKGIRSILILSFCLITFISIILAVPSMRERFFGGDKGDVTQKSNSEILSSTDNISTSGREFMWAYVIEKFYVGNEIKGCGLGSMKKFLRDNTEGESAHFEILHNDHLHILIETGLIGIILYELFYVVIIFSSFKIMVNREKDPVLRISAMCSLAMTLALIFFMYFGNLLSVPFSISIPYLFIGFFLKLNKIHNHK